MSQAGRLHFVGIGGAGLSAIARVCAERGYRVSGCDQAPSATVQALQALGVPVAIGHSSDHVAGADRLVISSAVTADHMEVLAAQARGVPVLKRADILGELMNAHRTVAVAGVHGKTTTTGLVAFVLDRAGLEPSFIVGGALADFGGSNARAGRGTHFVIEADEYDYMFLGLRPHLAVVTNVEYDHPDCFPEPEAMVSAFQAFVERILPGGALVAGLDSPPVQALAEHARQRGVHVIPYGLYAAGAEWTADSIRSNDAGGSDFLVVRAGETLGLVRNRLPGEHMVANSLAALAAAAHLGVDFNLARNALAEYRGAARRFEIKGEARGVTVVDDYAHHPTEIRATLAAARQRFAGRRLWAVFQPHTVSRTRALQHEFAHAFADADGVVLTDIFRSREAPDPTLSAADVVREMPHPNARYLPSLQAAADFLTAQVRPGDVVITLGAGDGDWVGEQVLKNLSN